MDLKPTFNGKVWLVPHLWNLCSSQQSHPSLLYELSACNNKIVTRWSKHTLPGEVCVVLVDQIFLDPEIVVACWEKHNLLMWGVVTIPEVRCDRIPRYQTKLKQAGCDNYIVILPPRHWCSQPAAECTNVLCHETMECNVLIIPVHNTCLKISIARLKNFPS